MKINNSGGVDYFNFTPPKIYGSHSITYTYEYAGNVLSEIETGANIETTVKNYTYDMLGKMLSSTDGKGKKTNYTYWGGMDWVKEIKTPFSGTTTGRTTYTYDILNT